MLRRRLLSLLAFALVASPARAAGPAKGGEGAKGAQELKISPVALPVVVDGVVVNYVFVEARLQLGALANLAKLQSMEPFFRDALVRAGHRTPFTRPDDYLSVDEKRLTATLLAEARRLGGKDVVSASVASQTPLRRTGVPQPPKA